MYKISKRIFDLTSSLFALIVLSPLMIPIMIGLKLTGEHYIWYLQERVGYKNKLFNIIKFASMLKDSPNMTGGLITLNKDPRLMPLGGFLRSTKINELPQIINILKGDMSVVGPRPVMKKSFNAYPPEIQSIIYNVKPGLTGIGSIVFRDEENLITEVKNAGGDTWGYYKNTIYPFKGKLEIWYQQNAGLLTDTKIIIITAWVIFFPNSRIVYKWFPTLPKREF
jgi:lipopolysaccharide/colanic/teichoic acid biosynthesis glycosyltransferase